MIEKILTPIFYGMIAAIVAGAVLLLTVAVGGPVLWIIMGAFGLLGFFSGIVRVRRGTRG